MVGLARHRGILAELQHQARLAEQRKRQHQAATARAQAAAQREADRTQRELVRLNAAMARASASDRARLQREAAEAQVAARLAEVDSRNADLNRIYDEIETLLTATLDVDDYVDLDAMKGALAQHAPFDPGPLATPTPALPELVYPPQPAYQEPAAPTGLGSAFGGRKKHEEAVARARSEFDAARRQWHDHATRMYADYVAAGQRREQAEAERAQQLAAAEAAYEEGRREATEKHAALNKLANDLAFDVESAINDYVEIVLSNSVYPDSFPVTYEHTFSLESRELSLVVQIPPPSTIPAVKEYRYVKSKDEITSTSLTAKAQKDRYAGAVWQVAVRTIHEVFEADRNGKIHTIALAVETRGSNPATGLDQPVPLVVTAADRDTFRQFDLSNVVPQATLAHLGASLSKSPFDLIPTDTTRGVRARGR